MTEQSTPKMTHDEMIDVLKGLVFGTFDRTTAKEREALDMAISALEKNESAEEWYKLLCKKWDEGELVYNFPKGMTNGGAIINLYPNLKYTIQNGRVVTTIGVAASFDLEWWDAPYKAESEE